MLGFTEKDSGLLYKDGLSFQPDEIEGKPWYLQLFNDVLPMYHETDKEMFLACCPVEIRDF